MQCTSTTILDSKDKAEILNDQFKSVFTLDKENHYPSMEGSTYPIIDNITTHTKWVTKLLKNVK